MLESRDLDDAVRAGVIPADNADALRNFVARRAGVPVADQERFVLTGGFAEIMTTIALFLTLGSATMVLSRIGMVGSAVVAGIAWGLAELLTRKRRMALPSFALFGFFALACTMCFLFVALGNGPVDDGSAQGLIATITPVGGIITAAGATMACFLFWWRFDFPIAYAAGAVALINLVVHVGRLLVPALPAGPVSLILLLSAATLFVVAMWWDMSDVYRQTRRADIAFWLHAAAGYQLAGASFRLIAGVKGNPAGWERLYKFAIPDLGLATASLFILLFGAFCVLALAIDRRSIMASSLVFVLPATAMLSGSGRLAGAFLLGVMLLLVSIFWRALRQAVVGLLPRALAAQLPRTELLVNNARPVA